MKRIFVVQQKQLQFDKVILHLILQRREETKTIPDKSEIENDNKLVLMFILFQQYFSQNYFSFTAIFDTNRLLLVHFQLVGC